MRDVTKILLAIENGEDAASDELLPIVYNELRRLANAKLRHEAPGQTLQATALVHEAYVRLVSGGSESGPWNSRRHFFSAAAEAMRRILVDRARKKKSAKHGGAMKRVELDNDMLARGRDEEIVALDEALERLEEQDKVKAELVKLRFFAGLTNKQAAKALEIGEATADRYWAYARSWLRVEISGIPNG